MTESNVFSTVRNNILFLDIEDWFLSEIVQTLVVKQVSQNTIIYKKGDISDGLYLVVSGQVEIFTERDDESYLLSHASAPYLFGEFLIQGSCVRSTCAKALTDTQLLFFTRDSFNALRGLFPEQGIIIGERILKRLYWNQTTVALRLSHLFVGLAEDVVRALISHMEIQSIPSSTFLTKQNAISNELWIVIDGQFQISKKTQEGDYVKLTIVGRGDVVGEVGVSCDVPRRSDVLATRDSTVARLSRESFESLLKQYPVEINQAFVKSIVGYLDDKHASKTKSAETFALVTLSTKLDINKIVKQWVDAFNNHGSTCALSSKDVDLAFFDDGIAQVSFDNPMNTSLLQWLSEEEIAHRHILYIIDNELSNWTRRCLRQADHIIFCVNILDKPDIGVLENLILNEIATKPVKKTLVLVHPNSTIMPKNTASWISNRQVDMHHHVKEKNLSDIDRVARFLTGNAVGLVLGGGGARGFAHIGVMRAFAELNIPIDLIGGNSMGAIIAAQYAMQWDYQEMIDKTRLLCLEGDQFTLPLMSIFSGNKMIKGIYDMFGTSYIEDLWLHFFSISCNISRATVMTHDKGTLISAVLNSNSPPGLFPPQIVDGDLLVDGALLNNVPVDVMARFNEGGTIIAVDVNAREDLLNNTDNTGGMNGWKLLINKINPFSEKISNPSIFEILARASIIGGLAQRKKLMDGVADLYMQPPVNNYSLMAYKDAEKIERVGYLHAKQELKNWLERKN